MEDFLNNININKLQEKFILLLFEVNNVMKELMNIVDEGTLREFIINRFLEDFSNEEIKDIFMES